jgi:hypothetical protein
MEDGGRLAVEVRLPKEERGGVRFPALLRKMNL